MNRGEIGKIAKVPTAFSGANLNSQIAYLRSTSSQIISDYLLYFLSSTEVSNLIKSMKMGSVLTQFPIANLLEISVPLPPHEEQLKIIDKLMQSSKIMDKFVDKAKSFIELSKERRTALISAAVTGKIDVRKEVVQYSTHDDDL